MSSATITAKIGPGLTATATVLTGVTELHFDTANAKLKIKCDQGNPEYDIYADTTVTYSISSHVVTLTVS